MERQEIIDMATGIAGGLLLVLAVVLFAVVPQDEPVPPTFQVRYVPTETTVAIGETHTFGEMETIEVPVTIDQETVHRIAFTVRWTDDIAASDPDVFNFVIVSPEGERVTEPKIIGNDPPNATSQSPIGTPTTGYTAVPMELVIERSIAAPPRDGPVPGEHLNEDAANARARLYEDLVTYPSGAWELAVYLDDAGDCPSPQADPERAFACAAETSGSNADDGNSLEVVSVTYTTYDVEVTEVQQP